MSEQRIPCRCLLADSFPAMAVTVAEYIASLPEEQKVPVAEYARRLEICRTCDALRDGTCGLCGCYVEARAAKRGQKCPHVPPKWEKYE